MSDFYMDIGIIANIHSISSKVNLIFECLC